MAGNGCTVCNNNIHLGKLGEWEAASVGKALSALTGWQGWCCCVLLFHQLPEAIRLVDWDFVVSGIYIVAHVFVSTFHNPVCNN